MYPVILKVVLVEPGGGEILREYQLIGMQDGEFLTLRSPNSNKEFLRVKVSLTHMNQEHTFVRIGIEDVCNRVITIVSDDISNNSKFKHVTLKSTNHYQKRLLSAINQFYQYYTFNIRHTA